MRTLDRYVAGLYIKVFVICVVGAPLMFMIIKLTDDIDNYLARGLTVPPSPAYSAPSSRSPS
jgi:lipopolysaccharide export LptBFGC system permease protein LptF